MEHEISQLAQALRAQTEQNSKMMGMFGRMASANSSPADKRKMERDLFSKPANRFEKALGDISDSTYKWNRTMDAATRATDKTSNSLKLLGADAGAAKDALSGMAKALLGGALGGVVVGGLINYVSGLTTAYQGMAEIGQNFGGSLISMTRAAAESQMTLERYTSVMKQNSELVAAMSGTGRAPLTQLMGSVRSLSKEFGMFGYTMEGLDDLTVAYMENLRIQGRLDQVSDNQARLNIRQMAHETSTMATMFGKARSEITKTTKDSMAQTSVATRIMTMNEADAKKATDALGSMNTVFAAMPGDIGKMMADFSANTFGLKGQFQFTKQYQDVFAQIGMGPLMADFAKKQEELTQSGDKEGAQKLALDTMNAMHDFVRQNAETLNAYVTAPDKFPQLAAAADQLLKFAQNPKRSEADMKKAAEEAAKKDEETKLALNAAQNWAEISSKAKLAMLPLISGPLSAFADGMKQLSEGKEFEGFRAHLGDMSKAFDGWVKTFVTKDNMKVFSDWIVATTKKFTDFAMSIKPEDITRFMDAVVDFGRVVVGVVSGLATLASMALSVGKVLWDVGSFMLSPILKAFGATVETLDGNVKNIVVALGVLYAGIKGFQMVKSFMGIRSMDVKAAVVNINGKGLGDVGGGGKGKGRFRRWGGKLMGGAGMLGAAALGLGDFLNGPAAEAITSFGGTIGEALFGKKSAEAAAEGAATVKGKGATETSKVPEPAKAATTAAEDAAKAGAKGIESGEMRALKATKLLKGLGILGTVLSTVSDGKQIYDLTERSKQEGWDDDKFREELTKLLAPMLTGTAGALVGGALGASGGTLVAPGIGSFIGGVGGAIGGGMAGDKLGEMIAPLIIDAIKKAPIGAVNTGEQFGPPIPANLKSPGEIDPTTVSKKIDEYMSTIEENRRVEAITNEKVLEQLQKNNELTRQQTEMQAQLLNRNNETMKNTSNNIVRAAESNGN